MVPKLPVADNYSVRVSSNFFLSNEGYFDITPPPLVFNDNGADPAGTLYEPDEPLSIAYNLGSGVSPYNIDWHLLLEDGTDTGIVLASDNGLDMGGKHDFLLDTLSVTPSAGSNSLPLGRWRLRGVATDSTELNDPDPTFDWPAGGGSYAVRRFNLLVVSDVVGDPAGVATVPVVADLLPNNDVTTISSVEFDAADLTGVHACIWPGLQVSGMASPYEWLSNAELGILRTYVDSGGKVIILAPPSTDSALGIFPQDSVFEASYQPFFSINAISDQTGDLDPAGFTRDFDFLITRVTLTAGDAGRNAPGTALRNGALEQVTFGPPPPMIWLSAFMPGPGGTGGVYMGMLEYPACSFSPPGETRAMYLDNIVAGTIDQ
jgi:hypothetical protein